ncbi:S1 family peptidase [Vibrio astriarenae]
MKQVNIRLPMAVGLSLLSLSVSADTPSARIIDGTPAEDNSWPFIGALVQASLAASQGQICGASYLGGRYVLTAAHCVEGTSANDIELVFGVNDLDDESQGTRISVNNIYMHEDYEPNQLLNDVAVLELPRELTSSEATPVTLSQSGRLEELYMSGDVTLTVAGWGTTVPNGGTVLPDSLLQVDVKLVSYQECNDVYDNVPSQNFCAGTPTEGQDSCRGDSGGPIIVKETGEQLGWVSWGDQYCGREGSYGVYADAGYFEGWLSRFTSGLSYTQNEHIGYHEFGTLTHQFSFKNTGTNPVTFSAAQFSELEGSATSIVNNTCSTQSLLSNESCVIEVQLAIDEYREYQAELALDYTIGSESYSITNNVTYEGVEQASSALRDVLTFDFDDVYVNDNPWVAIDGGIQSATIGDNQRSVVVIEGIPKGYLTVDVEVSSENGFDELRARINQTDLEPLTGSEAFSTRLSLLQSSNTLRLEYVKDASTSSGDDRAMLTNMQFSQNATGGITPVISEGSGGALSPYWLLLLSIPLLRRRRNL